MTPTILICSGDEHTRVTIKGILSRTFPLIVVEDQDQCLAALRQKALPGLAFVGTTADEEGTLFEKMRALLPELTVIAIGESGSEEDAVSAVNHGATGYTMLPLRKDDILAMAEKSLRA